MNVRTGAVPITDTPHPAAAPAAEHHAVLRSQTFQQLVRERTGFGWTLTIAMLVIYYGFILLVAFAPGVMAAKVGSGATSLGMVIGLVVILAAFALTGIYVSRANSRFDELTARLHSEFGRRSVR